MRETPTIYQAACVFSLIGGIIGFILMFLGTFFFDSVEIFVEGITNINSMKLLSPLYFSFLMAVYGVSIAGIINLIKRKMTGLIMYLIAQILIIILPVIWIGNDAFSIINLVFTIIFAGTYLLHYKLLQQPGKL